MEVGVGEVVEPAALGEQGVPHAAGDGDHLVGTVANGAGGQLAAAAARHLVARHALKAEDHAGGGVIETAQVLNGHLAAAAVVAGGVVGQGVAAGVVLLQPGHRVIGGLGLAVVLAVAVDRLLVHVVGLLIQVKEAGGVVAGALAGVQPLKGVDAGDGGVAVLVQDAHAGVVQTGHVPLEAGVEQLVGVLALHLQLLDLPDLGLEGHIEGGVVLAVALAVHAVVGLAQVVGQAQEVEGVAVLDVVKPGGAVGLILEHVLVAEGGGQHVGQGHEGGGGVLGLAGVGVVLAGHPLAFGLGLLLLPGHAGEAGLKIQVDLSLIARAGEEVHVKKALLALVQRSGVGGVDRVVDLVRTLVKLQVAEPAVAAVVGKLQVGEDGDDLVAVGVGQLLHAGAVAVAAHQHKDLVVVLDDIPQLAALGAELDGAGLGVGAVLQVMGGDDGGAVGVLLQHVAEPGLVGAVPACVVVGARAAARAGQGDHQVVVAARPQEHVGAVAVAVGGLSQVPAGAAGPGGALAGEAVVVVVDAAAPAVVVAHLHQELDARVGQAVEGVPGADILGVVVVVVHHVAQVDDAGHVQLVGGVDELVDGGVHHVGAVLHRVLGVGDEDDVVVVLIAQGVGVVAAEVFHIILRIGDKPLVLVQRLAGDADLLQAALEELVQAVPPGGAHPEPAVRRVGVHAHHLVGHIVPEGLAAVDIGGDLVSVGDDGDVVPHAALVHGHRPGGGGHVVVAVGVAGDELDLLAVGDGGVHGALLPLRVAAARALTANEAHPLVGGGPVLGEVVEELHGVTIGKLLAVDGRAVHSDEVGAGLGAVVAVKDHAAALAGHAVVGEGEVILPVLLSIGLHSQVVVVAALVLNDQAAVGNTAGGVRLVKLPVGHHLGCLCLLRRVGGRGGHCSQRLDRQQHCQRQGTNSLRTQVHLDSPSVEIGP